MGGERPTRPQKAQELGLTAPVWDMTLKCWQRDPALRPTVTEVVELLRESSVFSTPKHQHPDTLPAAQLQQSHQAP